MQRVPVHSMAELQNPYLHTHFHPQHLSVSTTPISTSESRDSGGSSGGEAGNSPTAVSTETLNGGFVPGEINCDNYWRGDFLNNMAVNCNSNRHVVK